ncbi:DUF2383 domain-containing protein [Erythrobacter sp. HL-111]|uniref:DUF2383 domain-containing protein n=1 Tax=Erythrobacter sp. HL-111 TaxID=1798193 RepID=UPI0006DAEE86|nr:DUF2383 domain-containing protein [Erythrobacter sp. HL-111]KPP87567.1 MAG: protein of unknown function containing DUF2383 domain [Erythrobacteraceae bacterium HL-111]SDR79680.1 conserved hypothetical protein [Erythrobacter sp. HL-111]
MADTRILQSLTQDTYDTLAAYRRARESAHSDALQQTLERRISERVRTVNLLNEALAERGGTRVDDASAPAQAADIFHAIGDAFQDGDEAAARRVEKAETELCRRYDKALSDESLDPSTRRTIEQAAREVREGESFSHVLERHYG